MIEQEVPFILSCVDQHLESAFAAISNRIQAIESRLPYSPEIVSQLRQELACANSALERANKRDAERIVELERLKLLSRNHYTCNKCGFAWFSEREEQESNPWHSVPAIKCMACEAERLRQAAIGDKNGGAR